MAQSRRAITGWLNNRYLKRLERSANDAPADVAAQLAFVKALGREHPEAALRRIETIAAQRSPTSAQLLEPLTREYLKALANTRGPPVSRVKNASESGSCWVTRLWRRNYTPFFRSRRGRWTTRPSPNCTRGAIAA